MLKDLDVCVHAVSIQQVHESSMNLIHRAAVVLAAKDVINLIKNIELSLVRAFLVSSQRSQGIRCDERVVKLMFCLRQ